MPFRDRRDGGRRLAAILKARSYTNPIVLGLPRGGVPVAFEVASAIGAELDVFVVRKLGVRGHEELAMGAIASGGVRVLVAEVVRGLGVADAVVERVTAREQIELERREHEYRGERPLPLLQGRTVIIVDDGVATGASMLAAISAVRAQRPAEIVAAAPVMSAEARARLLEHADACETVTVPADFIAVGAWYSDFAQTTDEEVTSLVRSAYASTPRDGKSVDGPVATGATP